MNEPIQDIKRRRPVWQALSELFLDTQLDDQNFHYIARVLAESGYDDEELKSILHREVAPVCVPNLLSPAGEWAGFSLDWLEESILRNSQKPMTALISLGFARMLRSVTESDWQEVLALLPEARHVSGNPYQPYPIPDHWPAAVVQLAEALHEGKDCGFALHDALLEGDHPALAEHFRQEKEHPKECWVLRMVLGRK